MILIGILAVAIVFDVAVRRNWRLAILLVARWKSLRPFVLAYLRRSPATFAYLVVLSVTTWVLLGTSPKVSKLVLLEHSTNLHELRINPIKVLIRSAFWAPGYEFLAWIFFFALVLAPAEYWLGTRRWVLVFATGHVLATVGSVTALWFAIRYGWAAKNLQETIDVGVSYGFAAVAAIFTYRLPPSWRWAWALSTVGIGLVALVVNQSFTDVGHFLALGVGFAFYPITRDFWVQSRKATPIWSTIASKGLA
ncbi:MAG TPA: rhomboid-like protein [Candidatus Nanopelagicaceae bacterium]|nr:rhomboid-like protein [Candidatus Nanopelagicaceae bacterium]